MGTAKEISRSLGYRPALDGLRCLAVMGVFGSHWARLAPGGYIGVDIFFVLSGFLITELLVKEFDDTGRITLRKFYMRRVLRLLPALVLLLACYVSVYSLGVSRTLSGPMALERAGVVLLYMTNWAIAFDVLSFGWLTHAWSLAVEEQFYTLWPLALLGLLRFCKTKKSVLMVVSAVSVSIGCYRAGVAQFGWSYARLYNGLDTRADSLMVGACAALIFNLDLIGPKRRLLRLLGLVANASLAVLVLFMFVGMRQPDQSMFCFGFSAIAAGAGCLILGLSYQAPGFHWAVSAFSNRFLVWVGRISYGVYLWHFPVIAFYSKPELGLPESVRLLFALATTLGVAAASYYVVERRFLKLKTAFAAVPQPIETRPIDAPDAPPRLYEPSPLTAQAEVQGTLARP